MQSARQSAVFATPLVTGPSFIASAAAMDPVEIVEQSYAALANLIEQASSTFDPEIPQPLESATRPVLRYR